MGALGELISGGLNKADMYKLIINESVLLVAGPGSLKSRRVCLRSMFVGGDSLTAMNCFSPRVKVEAVTYMGNLATTQATKHYPWEPYWPQKGGNRAPPGLTGIPWGWAIFFQFLQIFNISRSCRGQIRTPELKSSKIH